MAKSFHYRIRKTHRYLGLLLGIQFLFWTIGGIYFSWSNMDEIHGDLNRRPAPLIAINSSFVSPSEIIGKMKIVGQNVDSIYDLKLIQLSGKPFYQLLIKEKLVLPHANHSDKHYVFICDYAQSIELSFLGDQQPGLTTSLPKCLCLWNG